MLKLSDKALILYRKIFHYNRWESVKCCINGLGRMDLVHILAFQALKFWKSLMQSTNRTLPSTLKFIFTCVLGENVTIWFYCERIIVLQLRVLVYWRVKFLSIIPVFVLHVRLRVDWVCLLYGRITVCIWCYLLSVSVCLSVFTYCLFLLPYGE